MSQLANPHDAMHSLEVAIANREVIAKTCETDPTLRVVMDTPNGEMRLTYVRMEGTKVTALVMAIPCDPVESKPCFNIGYAVAVNCRGQGRAKEIVKAALAEMQHGFGRAGIRQFYVEAIVGLDNPASMRVAEQVISSSPIDGKDAFQGVPMRQYLRQVGTA